MSRNLRRGPGWLPSAVVRAAALGTVVARVTRAARVRRPVGPTDRAMPFASVVIPARDEAGRIGPLLDLLASAPGVLEVIVVDDGSIDGTPELAAASGARVVAAGLPPTGWTGKAWALQRGVLEARDEWVVTLDADTRPQPELVAALVARAAADGTDLLTVAGRFVGPSRGARWLHGALLTTLVYRFGPPGQRARVRPNRLLANGQCMVLCRDRVLAEGGFEPVAGHVVEDVALARRLAAVGARVDFLDAGGLLEVLLYESFTETARGWGRSIALPGVDSRARQLIDLVTLALTMPVPLVRLVTGRADPVDWLALMVRLGTLWGTRRAFRPADLAYWCSPLADGVAVAVLAAGVAVPRREWRGRRYR